MDTRPLGPAGPRVSEVGFCLPAGPERAALARRAWSHGVRVFWDAEGAGGFPEGAVVLTAEAAGVVRYNLLDQTEANAEIPRLARARRGVVAVHVLAGGALAGAGTRRKDAARVDQLRVLERKDRTLAQAAVQFVLSNESVSCAVVRVSTEAHLDEIAAAPRVPWLTGRDLEQIFELWANRYD